jgi:hypothetical protein
MPFKYWSWQYSIATAEGQRQTGLSTEFNAMYAEVGRPSILPGTEGVMQQPQLTTYAEIEEVRTVTGAAACNQLLAEGWVLLGVFPVTRIGEMTEGRPSDGRQRKQPQDTQRYVRRLVGYVVGTNSFDPDPFHPRGAGESA